MIVRGPRPTSSFTILPNAVLTNHRLSWKARGLLAYLLSKPDNWCTSSLGLARAGTDGRDAVRTGLAELEVAGYLVRTRRQGPDGRWATITTVYDAPVDNHGDNHGQLSTTGAGLSGAGKSGALTRTQEQGLIPSNSDGSSNAVHRLSKTRRHG